MTTIVLFGGPSDERHVSVASAQSIVRVLGSPLAWFWAPDGPVHDVAIDDLMSHQRAFEIDFHPKRPAIWPNLEQALDTLPVEDPVFLLALHGGPGEDGTVQRMMEKRGIAAKLVSIPGGNPVVFGEIKTPGATRTLVLYAHYDGQPLDPKEWATPPFTPSLRDKTLERDGQVIPLPAAGQPFDPEHDSST